MVLQGSFELTTEVATFFSYLKSYFISCFSLSYPFLRKYVAFLSPVRIKHNFEGDTWDYHNHTQLFFEPGRSGLVTFLSLTKVGYLRCVCYWPLRE